MSHVRIEEMLAESGLAREEMVDVVDLLLPLDDLVEDAPEPSAELAALLGPPRPRPVSRVGGRRSAVAGALVLALSGVGATGLSAAANTLPRPLQHQVSQFAQNYLPFDLPEPPAPHRRSQGLPALTPAPTGERGGLAATSRSTPGREPDPQAVAPATATGQAQPSPTAHATATSSAQPSAAPTYATESAGPSPSNQPSYQPFATGSPTPTDRPRDGSGKGHHDPDPGQDDKGKGHGSEPGKGTDPGTGQGNGGHSPTPSPGAPAPTVPTVPGLPVPQPDPPLPTVPVLPDPLPGLGTIGGTGADDNPVDTD